GQRVQRMTSPAGVGSAPSVLFVLHWLCFTGCASLGAGVGEDTTVASSGVGRRTVPLPASVRCWSRDHGGAGGAGGPTAREARVPLPSAREMSRRFTSPFFPPLDVDPSNHQPQGEDHFHPPRKHD